MSQRLLDDSAFEVEGWLAGRIADKFARAEAASFISGNGGEQADRVSHQAAGGERHLELGQYRLCRNRAWTGDFETGGPGDSIIDLVYALGAEYRANASFVMNSKTAGAVRKIKDADGRFLLVGRAIRRGARAASRLPPRC